MTVAESKRLIAKGVAAMPVVKKAMKEGIVVVPSGTTNGYVVEELLGKKIDKRRYWHGAHTPKVAERRKEPPEEGIPDIVFEWRVTQHSTLIKGRMPDVVFKRGEVVKELNRFTALKEMGRGDVYMKGANALDYKRKMAGVLIGNPTGGTLAAALGHIVGKKLNYLIPIGLEKLVYEDINELCRLASAEDGDRTNLWPVTGTIITEIEALNELTGVRATLLAAGGIAGAEGAVRLLLDGTEEQVEAAIKLIESIRGEPRFLL